MLLCDPESFWEFRNKIDWIPVYTGMTAKERNGEIYKTSMSYIKE
jgi:hypothetical protein